MFYSFYFINYIFHYFPIYLSLHIITYMTCLCMKLLIVYFSIIINCKIKCLVILKILYTINNEHFNTLIVIIKSEFIFPKETIN